MNKYETLLDVAEQDGITIAENFDLSNTQFKGLYCDGVIAIDRDIDTDAEKIGILAEELGHHHTTYGNILDMHCVENRKQELRARLWAYDKLIGLTGIISAYKHSCTSLHEMAEFLEVTEKFLSEAINQYKVKYGPHIILDKYIIYFEPILGVMERI